ncbi:MAG: radical SAM protein [Clostridia bacterium]|nr:radical SAM protein [Clostridia bacterium]
MICRLCPRNCGAERTAEPAPVRCAGEKAPAAAAAAPYCGAASSLPVVAAYKLHFGEEPCISPPGSASGTVFFSGCSLRCIFCQNAEISLSEKGVPTGVRRLREMFDELVDMGAANINLVTADHYIPAIAEALTEKPPVPVVFNCSGYEKPETLRLLEGRVDIYMPDVKYSLPGPAYRYSRAGDYPAVARAAVAEMYRQTGDYETDEDGVMRKGVLVRHLILPGNVNNSFGVIDWFARTFRPGQALFSLMAQYTPMRGDFPYPELCRRVTREEYDAVCERLFAAGIEDGFVQEPDAAGKEFIPEFDYHE